MKRILFALVALLAVPVFAAPVVVGKISGISECKAPLYLNCLYEIPVPVSQLGAVSGDQLVAFTATGTTYDGGAFCTGDFPAGWTLVFSKTVGGLSNGKNLCAYTKSASGTEADFTLNKGDDYAVAWVVFRVSGASSAVGNGVSGGNPPNLNLGASAATVWLAAEFGKATTGPAGYVLESSVTAGNFHPASLSTASYSTAAASEDPGAFAPLGSIAATVGIR